jgi:hypothetical protein
LRGVAGNHALGDPFDKVGLKMSPISALEQLSSPLVACEFIDTGA